MKYDYWSIVFVSEFGFVLFVCCLTIGNLSTQYQKIDSASPDGKMPNLDFQELTSVCNTIEFPCICLNKT